MTDPAAASPKLCIVVLNWNGWEDSLECLESILPSVGSGLASVAVVDNASTDDSVARLRAWMQDAASKDALTYIELAESDLQSGIASERKPRLALIEALENRGYSAGNNMGIRFALEHARSEFILILNNDTVIHKDAIPRLLRYADSRPDAGIIGCTIVDHDDRNKVECAGGVAYNPWLTMYYPQFAGADPAELPATDEGLAFDYICGSAMLLRSAMVREIGPLCTDYFLYYEELDYAARAQSAGYRMGWCPSSIVYHKGGASAGSRSRRNEKKSAMAEYHCNLSALTYTRKHLPALLPVAFASRFCLKLVNFVVKRECYLLPALLRAYRDFLIHRRGSENG